MERRPLLWTYSLTVTNLTIPLLAVAALAMITIASLALEALRGSPHAVEYFTRRRIPLGLLLAYLLSSVASTVLSPGSTQGVTWFLGVLTGTALWLALPLWLADDTRAKVGHLGRAIVAGAVVAGMAGLLEVLPGSGFEQHLRPFKFGPDTMGPVLRLSATFSSANVAAMDLELALPFAFAGLVGGLGRTARRWTAFAWLAAIDVLLVALVLTYSRGALLGLLTAGLAVALAGRGGWRVRAVTRWREATAMATSLALVFGIFAFSTSSLQLLRYSTQNDRVWYQAAYAGTVPTSMPAGITRDIPVTVENRSPLTWSASSPHTYGLSYHWLRPSWKVVRFANAITWLSADLRPGGRQLVRVSVTAPKAPGRYLLIWDMVWKGTTWFGPKTGTYRPWPVRVIEAKGRGSRTDPTGRLPPPDITALPTAPALDRGQIWAVALAMIERRPALGLGPQGVRMNYGAFAPPGRAAWAPTPPPHAHNLALEMLADWGLIGGGLFFGLLAALWWPLLRRVVRGHVESGWELAVIGAAAALLGHELVDYFLNKQAIVVDFWLLCGLAATMSTGARAAIHERSHREGAGRRRFLPSAPLRGRRDRMPD